MPSFFYKYIMKLKYLFERTEDILRRINESEGLYSWKFVANPTCCEKCRKLNGFIAHSDKEPQWYAHVPDMEGRFNCRCRWKLIGGAEIENEINSGT